MLEDTWSMNAMEQESLRRHIPAQLKLHNLEGLGVRYDGDDASSSPPDENSLSASDSTTLFDWSGDTTAGTSMDISRKDITLDGDLDEKTSAPSIPSSSPGSHVNPNTSTPFKPKSISTRRNAPLPPLPLHASTNNSSYGLATPPISSRAQYEWPQYSARHRASMSIVRAQQDNACIEDIRGLGFSPHDSPPRYVSPRGPHNNNSSVSYSSATEQPWSPQRAWKATKAVSETPEAPPVNLELPSGAPSFESPKGPDATSAPSENPYGTASSNFGAFMPHVSRDRFLDPYYGNTNLSRNPSLNSTHMLSPSDAVSVSLSGHSSPSTSWSDSGSRTSLSMPPAPPESSTWPFVPNGDGNSDAANFSRFFGHDVNSRIPMTPSALHPVFAVNSEKAESAVSAINMDASSPLAMAAATTSNNITNSFYPKPTMAREETAVDRVKKACVTVSSKVVAAADSPPSWLFLYFVFNLGLTLYNKLVLVSFPFPWTLTAVQMLFGSICTRIALHKRLFSMTALTSRESCIMVAFSVLYTINIAVSNLSLQLVTVPFHQVVRAMTPLFTVLLSLMLTHKKHSRETYASLVPVVLGVVFATYGDYYFTWWGLVLTLAGTILAASKTIVTNMIQVGRLKLHPLDLLVRMSPLAFVQCIVIASWSGEWARVQQYSAEHMSPRLFLALAANGLIAFGLNVVSFTANKKTSALTMTVAANIKQVLTIVLAVIIFHITLNGMNLAGITLTLLGGAWYAQIELNEKFKLRRSPRITSRFS